MHTKLTKAALAAGVALALAAAGLMPAQAAVTVTNADTGGVTIEELAQSLVGDDTAISNVQLTGSLRQAGTFDGFETLGTEAGVVLATGVVSSDTAVSAVPGPNTKENTGSAGTSGGDADLDALLAEFMTDPPATLDSVSLEFDFVPTTDAVRFSYIFGSEEYIDYVGSKYSDVFGLFVNGTNCATVGDDAAPVSINTINPAMGDFEAHHEEFYRDNATVDGTSPLDTGFNGVTTVLTCQVSVNQDEPNHIKFAIADVSDRAYDSGVFIVAGSFITEFPIPQDDAVKTVAGQPVTVDVLSNDTGKDLALKEVTTQPENGTATVVDGKVVYTPAAGYSGPDSFTYTVTGVNGTTATAKVTVTVPPLAADDTASLPQGMTVILDVMDNDLGSDLAIDTTSVSAPAHGTATLNEDGTISYAAAADFAGTDEFTYSVTDAAGQKATGTVTIDVIAPPTATDDSATTKAGTAVTIDVLANDEGGTLTISGISKPSHGEAVATDGKIVYTPAAGYSGPDTFTYTIQDALGATATAKVTVTITATIVADTGGTVTTSSAGTGWALSLSAFAGLAAAALGGRRLLHRH